MASSGALARAVARSLDLPESIATTAMKVLRAEAMISMQGRGVNAAMMTARDAATFLVAVASGAIPSQLREVTNFLLAMKMRDRFDTGPAKGLSRLRLSANAFNSVKAEATLLDALVGLLEQTGYFWIEEDDAVGMSPLDDLGSLRFMLGTDPKKAGGAAVLRARVSKDHIVTYYFSTWEHREEETSQGTVDLLDAFNCPSGSLSIAAYDGTVIDAVIRSLDEAIPPRYRFRRGGRG